MIQWNREALKKLSNEEIETLSKNARRIGNAAVHELCDEELAFRKPLKSKSRDRVATAPQEGMYVSEFHFVCPQEVGVTPNLDGTLWSGTWVVAQAHAESAVEFGARVFLHVSKSEISYLQGTVKAWRSSERQLRYNGEQTTQIKQGIDFLLEPISTAMNWVGNGTGEKGYLWVPFPT